MSRKNQVDLEELSVHPLTSERWTDFETLFTPHAVLNGCWCMWWRMTRAEYSQRSPAEKNACMRAIVDQGRVPGLLGYLDGQPVAWVSVAPRDEYPSLDRSRVLGRLDELPVWSMVCFYFAAGGRHRGLMDRMIAAGVDYARRNGAGIVEAYPVDPQRKVNAGEIFMGILSAFTRAGFVEVARRSPSRPVVRLTL